jgi:ubiquinone/menaquinone biosynthesis C-methylase UbiE
MIKIETYWKEAFNESASRFQEDHLMARWSKHGLDRRVRVLESIVARLFPHPQNVNMVDAGCGPATLAFRLAGKGFRVLGVDYSPEMVSKAAAKAHELQANGSQMVFCVGDVEHLPVPGSSVELLTCVGVFQHLSDTQTVLKEFARALKPSGVCIVNAPSARFLLRKKSSYYRWFSPTDLEREARSAGFGEVETRSFVLLPGALRVFEGLDRFPRLNSLLWPLAHDLVLIARKNKA